MVRTRSMAGDCSAEIQELKAMLMEETSGLKQDIKLLLKGQDSFNATIRTLIEDNKKKDIEINSLKKRVDELEQNSRRENIMISGLAIKNRSFSNVVKHSDAIEHSNNPSQEEIVSLEKQILNFIDTKNIHIDPNEISTCHTIKTKDQSKPDPIIMRFVSRKTKDRVLRSGRNLKGCSVFINEHLTSQNAHIASLARRLLKDKQIAGTWTRNGTVYIKVVDNGNTKIHVVKEAEFLHQYRRGQNV